MNPERNTKKRIPQPVRPGKVARVPMVMQMEALECGAACLDMILAYYGRFVPLSQLRKECGVNRDGSNLGTIIACAEYYGLKASACRASAEELKTKAECPCMLFWNGNHFVVLDGYKNGRFTINDPGAGIVTYREEQFAKEYSGICTMFRPTEAFVPGGTRDSVVGYLKSNLKGALPMTVLILITTLIFVLTGILQPVFPRFLLDYLLTGRASSSWNRIFFTGFAVIAAIQLIVLWIRNAYLVKMQGKMAIYSSTKFLWHVLKLPMDFFSQRYPSDIINRSFANESIAYTVIMDYVPLVLQFASMLFYLVMMVVYSPFLTAVGVAAMIVNLIVTLAVSRKSSNEMRVRLKNEAEFSNAGVNGIQMIETIKSCGSESGYFRKWAGLAAEFNNETVEINRIDTLYEAVSGFVTNLTSGLILCISVGLVMKGEWTIGLVSVFAAYMNQFTAPSMALVSSIASFRELSTNIERVKDVMDYREDPVFENTQDADHAGYRKLTGNIEIKNVTFGYNTFKEPLIRDFSMKISPGERIAFVGSSGSGKSTMAKLLTGLCKPWEGEILYDGKTIDEIDRNIFVASVASVDQSIAMFPDTIYNNITMWDQSIPEDVVVQAAKDAEIYEDIMNCENGLETRMIEGGRNFSGGQRQRIEIARALASEPSILIMDEATSALDAETEYKIIKEVRRKRLTTIMISHRLSAVRDCDCIIVLKNGVVLDRGTHTELMERCAYYAEMITNE